ncbi:hypothetical protein ALP65_200001 [Pseudomonas aeruginosa]|uniref:Uncharacterized protein n=1 Tax=Pseudomonas aeruginosa TaxID=287 RepID=A0A3M5DQS0_PSEAI|nr:hypothetical protein ALP65_200001 [Pseudomonas aeruginosa]
MSDSEAKKAPEVSERVRLVAEFSVERLNDHFERNGGLNPCEACGEDDWTISQDSKGRPTMIQSPIFDPPSNALLFVPVFCGKCGNTRFINVAQAAGVPRRARDDGSS